MKEKEIQTFTISCVPESRICHVGEKAEFTISAPIAGTEAEVVFTADGEAELERKKITTPCTLKQGLPFPGVLRCEVSAPGMKPALAGAAFDPCDIRPALPEPEDFREFWDDTFARLEKIPADFQMKEIPELAGSGHSFYDLSCTTLNGGRCYAFLRLPHVAGPVPMMIYFAGAGPGLSREGFVQHCANADSHFPGPVALLLIFTHNYHPGDTYEEHQRLHEAYMKSLNVRFYWSEGLVQGREHTFFYRAIPGAVRMCRLVSALPAVNRERITYLGGSQGGAFGIFLSAFCPEINAAFCGDPAFCDCGGFLLGRHHTTSHADYFREHYQVMRYFDPVNFAPMIKVPVFTSCGFIDTICPASSVYAAYNALGGSRMIFNKPLHGHGDVPEEYAPLSWFWVGCHLGLFK
ncbi:MAG: acetylxylan esterase [Lentisphaeria bacterium]|nr:acetylxylan esterase [Lentisphaeria bacterium]